MEALEMRKKPSFDNPILFCFSYVSPALHPTLLAYMERAASIWRLAEHRRWNWAPSAHIDHQHIGKNTYL